MLCSIYSFTQHLILLFIFHSFSSLELEIFSLSLSEIAGHYLNSELKFYLLNNHLTFHHNVTHKYVSQWPKWLRRQYGKLEICGSSPGYDTNFSLKVIIYMSIWYKIFNINVKLLLIFKKAVPIHLLIIRYDYSQNVTDRIL